MKVTQVADVVILKHCQNNDEYSCGHNSCVTPAEYHRVFCVII
jgi:hypothetical protein